MTNLLGLHCAEPGAGGVHPLWDDGPRVFVVAIGHDPHDHSGHDYTRWSSDRTIIVRLQHGWDGGGCIPTPDLYPQFAQRAANYVAASIGIDYVIIGNEPNHSQEWPDGNPIDSADFVDCFDMCYDAIKTVKPSVKVAVGAIAPYNAEMGDWIGYYDDVIDSIYKCDAIAIHAYSRGQEPEAITDPAKMDSPYEDRYSGFQVYREWCQLAGGPFLLTEFNPINDPPGWEDRSTDVIWEALREINEWNDQHPAKPILCVCCYRSRGDVWAFEDKANVVMDYQTAASKEFEAPTIDKPQPPEEPTMTEILDGFESGFYTYNGVGELKCPTGWKPQWDHDPQDGVLNQPEYQPSGTAQIRTGDGAAAIHARFTTIDGVLARSFEVVNGGTVAASVWMLKTEDAMGHGMQIGIDPTGGNDHTSAAVVWSDWYSQNSDDYAINVWRQRAVETVAQSNVVTVYLRAKVDFAANSANAHFDDFSLFYEGDAPEPPDPEPPVEGDVEIAVQVNGEIVWRKRYGARMVEVT